MIMSDTQGHYVCHGCGEHWKARDRFVCWPISLRWRRGATRIFAVHGFQVGWDGVEQRVFGWTLHLGALKVVFGAGRKVEPSQDHARCAA